MKIWIDVLTPKQVLFFESLISRLEKKGHKVFVTSRDYREAKELIKSRKMKVILFGRFGGGSLIGKLNAENQRTWALTKYISQVKPDLAISMHNPNVARIAFGLGIKHYMFSNAPHHVKVMKLSIPLVDKLFIPEHISKNEFTEFGISDVDIFQYNAMDEYVLLKNKHLAVPYLFEKKIILVRSSEYQASYKLRKFDNIKMIKTITKTFKDHIVVVLPRYQGEISFLKRKLPEKVKVLSYTVDSKLILDSCEVFVGSGGTMTSESVLRGVPTLSVNSAPNLDEKHLVDLGMLPRAETIPKIIKEIKFLLDGIDKKRLKKRAKMFVGCMENPHSLLIKSL